jgi:2-hydroxy-6-oxonona-2,4-dienedioate hydrolase
MTTTASPEDQIGAVEARCERGMTSLGACTMVWRRWPALERATHNPLVLLHGGSGSWRHWIRNIEVLGRDRDVWAPDLPGFGESGRPPPPVNFAAVAKVVSAGLRELLPDSAPFDLAGFSFGSHTIQYVASEMGSRAGTAVLVTAHMLGPMLAQPNQLLERWRDVTDPAERERILKRNLGSLMLAHEASMDPLALYIYASDVVRARIRPATFINDRDFTLIERLPCRVAGIAGALDPLGVPSPAAQGEALMMARPDARFHLIENAGHWVCYEAPDAFNAVLRTFLDT